MFMATLMSMATMMTISNMKTISKIMITSGPRQPFDHDDQWTYIAILVVFVIQSPFSVLPSDSIRIGSWWGIAQESHKSRFRTELPPRSINQDGIEMHLIHILISRFLIFQPVQHIREMKVKVTFDFSDAALIWGVEICFLIQNSSIKCLVFCCCWREGYPPWNWCWPKTRFWTKG